MPITIPVQVHTSSKYAIDVDALQKQVSQYAQSLVEFLESQYRYSAPLNAVQRSLAEIEAGQINTYASLDDFIKEIG